MGLASPCPPIQKKSEAAFRMSVVLRMDRRPSVDKNGILPKRMMHAKTMARTSMLRAKKATIATLRNQKRKDQVSRMLPSYA